MSTVETSTSSSFFILHQAHSWRKMVSIRAVRPIGRIVTFNASRRALATSSIRLAGTGDGNIVSDRGTQQGPGSGNSTGPSRKHAVDKADEKDPNIQSHESSAGRLYVAPSHPDPVEERRYTPTLNLRTGDEGLELEQDLQDWTYADTIRALRREKARDSGGNATRQADEHKSTQKAKKEHPEAPDVIIGMQDERGGKGA